MSIDISDHSYKLTVTVQQGSSSQAITNYLTTPAGISIWDDSTGSTPVKNLELLIHLFHLSLAKGSHYKGSWNKRGELVSIFGNLSRKWDRIESSIQTLEKDPHADPSPRIDGVGDLLVYCMLYLTWMEKEYPAQYQQWMDNEVLGYLKSFNYKHNKTFQPD